MRLLLLYLILVTVLSAQMVRASVSIEATRFTASQRNTINQLKPSIEEYVNQHNWTGNDLSDLIEINITLIMQSVIDETGLPTYKAQVVFNSTANETFVDKSFTFTYKSNEPIQRFGSEYQPIGNFLDFYVNMILGGEMDTFEPFGGEVFYGKARDAMTVGLARGDAAGWSGRQALLKDYTSSMIRPVRKAKYLYYAAEYAASEKNIAETRTRLTELITELSYAFRNEPNNLMFKRYMEGYHKKILALIDPTLDSELIQTLILIDPARKSVYEKYITNEG